ncbi:hypothetical protein C4546_01060 [Candidatus Parcubacteria bacterium]|nr:MAG: hypothetical protein C4546_01060 [Candidatus Parcubacteria bacterium]
MLFTASLPLMTQAKAVDIYFFWGDGCPHCAKEKIFLEQLQKQYGDDINIQMYEIYFNVENRELWEKMTLEKGLQASGVPTTFIGSEMLVGFDTNETTGNQIQALLQKELAKLAEKTSAPQEARTFLVSLPLLGSIDAATVSLPMVTIIIAALDGFNPCAMWVLVLLIGMLIGMQNRKRLWILGLSFIVASAAIYFVFLAAWFNFFKLIGVVRWLQALIGVFAAGVGVYYIRRFFVNKSEECTVTNLEQKQKISNRMTEVIQKRSLFLALIGIIILAILINTIELACSAGLPAIYTQILAMHDFASWQHYSYLLLYTFIFMLDDMLIFAIAIFTFRSIGFNGKYSRIASIIGGVVVFFIGLLLIFRPDWVMFG